METEFGIVNCAPESWLEPKLAALQKQQILSWGKGILTSLKNSDHSTSVETHSPGEQPDFMPSSHENVLTQCARSKDFCG